MGPSPKDPRPAALRRDLGTVESYAVLVGILVGAGIFRVTKDAYEATGASVVLGYLVLAPVILATAIPYAAFQSTPLALGPAGDYGHIRAVFGRSAVTFLAAWLKLISYLGALAFLSLVLADYLLELLHMIGILEQEAAGWRRPVATACLLIFWLIHCAGVRWFGRVQVAMCLMLGLSILVLVVPGLFAIEMANYRPFFGGGSSGFLASLPPLFFAYAGFEAIAHTAGEVRESQQRLPGVYLRGVLVTTAIFVAMSAVSVGVLSAAEIAASKTPMATAAAKFLPVGGVVVVTLGGILAAATSVNATMAVPARLAITVAQDGHLPKSLAAIHPGTGTPVFGLTLSLGFALLLLWSGQLGFALNIAVLALMAVYSLHSLAFLLLPRRAPDLRAQVTLRLPWAAQRLAAWAALLALGSLIARLVAGDLETMLESSLAERFQQSQLTSVELFVVWVLLGWILFMAARRSRTPA